MALIFFLIGAVSMAQEIQGKVFDSNTKEPIVGASVYFNASSIGTITDEEGNFKLGLPYENNAILVVRHIGYVTRKVIDPSTDSTLQLGLTEDIQNLSEVVLTSDPFTRKEKMKVFKLEFLGDTRAGRSCEILNEDQIKLYFNSYNNTLEAYCEAPIKVRNGFMGYVIYFDIEEFKVSFREKSLRRIDNIFHTLIDGSTQFFDVSEGDPKILERREKAYLGSTVHFMRSCWHGDVESQNFSLKRNFKEASIKDMFNNVEEDVSKDLKKVRFLDKQFVIYFKNKGNYRSTLKIAELDSIYSIDIYGNYTPYKGLVFGGYMANFRIGDMLPMDYGM
ncbi:carboxypeptidase-like regulatory domain-containing protein [Flagellimonas aequoris]|nr:carboxypeptidase-like regulatory domain-containing protein [Allomuricauda aequoris]